MTLIINHSVGPALLPQPLPTNGGIVGNFFNNDTLSIVFIQCVTDRKEFVIANEMSLFKNMPCNASDTPQSTTLFYHNTLEYHF